MVTMHPKFVGGATEVINACCLHLTDPTRTASQLTSLEDRLLVI